MNDALITLLKAVNGGLFVVAFALIGEIATPKRFSGVFSAAPSIALANLIVIALAKGGSEAQRQSTGMIVGAIAMTIACAIGVLLLRRYQALRGSLAICGTWLVLAEVGYVAVLR
jgi:hypothetical protein